jgi:hypothetical protein
LKAERKQYRNIRQTSSACDLQAVSFRMQNEVMQRKKSRVETRPFVPVTCG